MHSCFGPPFIYFLPLVFLAIKLFSFNKLRFGSWHQVRYEIKSTWESRHRFFGGAGLMLVPINLTSSGSHPAWKKVSLLYSPKRIRVRLNNKSFQFVTQMKNIKTKKKKKLNRIFTMSTTGIPVNQHKDKGGNCR